MTTPYRTPEPVVPEVGPRALHYAHSLELALPTDLLALDPEGNVRAPSRTQRARYALPPALFFVVAALAAIGAVLVSITALRAACVFVAFVYLFVGTVYILGRRSVRATRLLAHAKLDEAKEEAEALLRHPILGAAFQSSAQLCLARIADRRGAHAGALEHLRAIRYRRAATAAKSPERIGHVRERALYAEVIALCNLGREGEARALLAESAPRRGDYLRLLAQTATLYVELCEGSSKVSTEELAAIVETSSRMATSWALLSLAAWHLDARGDAEGAAKLLGLAATLPRGAAMDATMPRLWAWVSRGATPA